MLSAAPSPARVINMVNPQLGNLTTPVNIVLPSGATVSVPVFFCQFNSWQRQSIEDTYGGKAVIDYNGEPLFAELVILRLLEKRGWNGVWVDTYGRRFRNSLPPSSCELPQHAANFFEKANSGRKWAAGCFDVFAWNEGQHLFVEAKRKGKDAIRVTQRQWLEVALNSGISVGSFLIFEWDVSAAELG